MKRRLTRKQMKRDEFRVTFLRVWEAAQRHTQTILLALGGAVVLGLAILGVRAYLEHRTHRAQEAMAEALVIYRAPIGADAGAASASSVPSFPDKAARRQRAKELFEKIGDRYGSTAVGDLAGVYLAEIALQEGEVDRAHELWSRFLEERPGHLMAAAVRLNLISLDREGGRSEELVEELRAALEGGDGALPEDALLFELAVTLENLGRTEEAQETFQRLIDDFPRSAYAGEARRYVTPGTGGSLIPPAGG